MAKLAGIRVFPIKAMDGVPVAEARLTASGALEGDRRLALFDPRGKFVNGKRYEAIHRLRSDLDWNNRLLTLRHADQSATFHLDRQRNELEGWLGDYFGFPILIKENAVTGFPDDTDAPGPTVISTGTIQAVASWFPKLDAEQVRRRFRANLEIADVPAFWEDRLYGEKGQRVRFRIGEVLIDGNNPCQRCNVPPRDPDTGEDLADFGEIFLEKREQTLPPWANRSRFDHFYRLAVNTVIPADQAGKIIRPGDAVTILE